MGMGTLPQSLGLLKVKPTHAHLLSITKTAKAADARLSCTILGD
jgi:hypothetical protein